MYILQLTFFPHTWTYFRDSAFKWQSKSQFEGKIRDNKASGCQGFAAGAEGSEIIMYTVMLDTWCYAFAKTYRTLQHNEWTLI